MPGTVKVIAEAASNHGGSLKLAKEMIRVAAGAGADYIKFQSWQAGTLRDREKDPQYEWFIKAELADEAHRELVAECKARGIGFLTTCFDVNRIGFLAQLNLSEIKVGSPDLGSPRLLLGLKERFQHLIVSTGLALDAEVEETAKLLNGCTFTLMHCISMYPVPPEKVNLARMDWLRRFTPSVGYSDHCAGIEAVKLAVAMGAAYVEKHFSLGPESGCRFSPWDATPQEMEAIARYSKECQSMLGSGNIQPGVELVKSRQQYLGRWGDNR